MTNEELERERLAFWRQHYDYYFSIFTSGETHRSWWASGQADLALSEFDKRFKDVKNEPTT